MMLCCYHPSTGKNQEDQEDQGGADAVVHDRHDSTEENQGDPDAEAHDGPVLLGKSAL